MRKVSIVVTSSPQSVTVVTKYAEKLKERFSIGGDRFGDVLISLTEAVNNAIIHGNNSDSKKLVTIKSFKSRGLLTISVSDEGNGFQHDCLPDPTAPENICDCGGRGVFLMKELCDKISYADNGSTVNMCFSV